MEYRLIKENEIDTVIKLVDRVAKEYVFLDFETEGISNFNLVNTEDFYLNKYNFTYVCLDDNKIIGMISLTNKNHLSLLFVDKNIMEKELVKN